MKIKEIEKDQRPREKALRLGIRTLSDVELLALILQSGNKNHPVYEIAQEILQASNSLANLFDLHAKQLMEIPGIREEGITNFSKCRIMQTCDASSFLSIYNRKTRRYCEVV